jgi:phosphohistidine phosphatase
VTTRHDRRMDTRRIVLVRHGKAEAGEERSDHDRRLTSTGQRDAAATGRWLAERLDRVDRVWVSSAVRAQQTWAAMVDLLPDAGTVDVDHALYQAGAREVVEWAASTDVPVALVVGHNPTLEQALAAITGELRGMRAGSAAIVEMGPDRAASAEVWSPG